MRMRRVQKRKTPPTSPIAEQFAGVEQQLRARHFRRQIVNGVLENQRRGERDRRS